MKIKIASFNCNSVRARLPIVLDWLERHSPDVLGLQETKCQDADFPAADFAEAGYRVVFRGQKSYNGVALVSREQAADVAFGLDDGGPPDEPRIARAKFGGVWVINTYVPQGNEPDTPEFKYKLEWFGRLRSYFERHFTPRQRLVWVGDFNVAPTPIDVYDSRHLMGHVCHRPEVFDALDRVRQWGFVDVFRKHHPEPGCFTFFDYRVKNALGRGVGWRVDHVYATKTVAAASLCAEIDTEPRSADKPSDHTPIWAEFDV